MKTLALLCAAIVLGAVLTGCASHRSSRTYKTPDSEVTVKEDNDGKDVQVQTSEGTATLKEIPAGKTVSEKEIGAPVYPGAKASTLTGYDAAEPSQGSMQQYQLSTTDSFDKVYTYYQKNLKDIQSSYSGSEDGRKAGTIMSGKSANALIVNIVEDKDQKKTIIVITRMQSPSKSAS